MVSDPRRGSSERNDFLDEAARALFLLGRLFGRQTAYERPVAAGVTRLELSSIAVVQAIELAREQRAAEITIGMLAERLGLDPSTASRVVAAAISSGSVRRVASVADDRRVCVELTARGETLARDARAYQRQVFLEATRGFSAPERQQFARLFVEFARAVTLAYTDTHRPTRSRQALAGPAEGGEASARSGVTRHHARAPRRRRAT
jgi:DNA-binding MarR family transcriptional regulator